LVVCIDPVAGQVYRKIEFPCVETTACAFGGPELNRLFVTTGLHKTLQEPDAGRIFVVDGLHASGTPSFSYGR
jgi:sugar lactone lactonase YvrE